MLEVELRLCQRLAKEFGLPVEEIKRIERSQFKQVTRVMQEKQGKAFAIPYLGEFDILPSRRNTLEVKYKVEENNGN